MELLSWGANGNGQLGHGHERENEVTRPTKVPGSDCLNLPRIQSIVGGGAHTILIVDDGGLYVCGRNNRGQLGLVKEKIVLTFQPVIFPTLKIKSVACGWEHNVAVTEDGALYCWGANSFGQLGVPTATVQYSATPIRVNISQGDVSVSDISAGIRHSVAVTATGSIYSWGSGKKGQLGIVTPSGFPPKIVDLPQQVPFDEDDTVVQVVCGSYHTNALTGGGRLWVWGSNDRGQLVRDPGLCQMLPKPHLVDPDVFDGSKLKAVYSGWTHTVAKTEDGRVYTWGRNDYGQLGRVTSDAAQDWKPAPVAGIANSIQIFVGSEHNVVVVSDATRKEEKIYTWGWNEHGICGNDDEENVRTPTEIARFGSRCRCTLIGGGCGHNFVMTAPTSR